MLETGTVLNNIYRVVKLLGKGAMGNVYLVERVKDDKQFVVKELVFTKAAGVDENTAREIFHREAEFMAKFDFHGLAKTHGIFSQDSNDYLVMDYIDGKTLEEIITSSEKPLDEAKAIKWTIELCEIIDYLHNSFEKPIVYRDLKPSNIIITPEGRVKLVDFGIARYYNPDKNTDTFSYGSPGYAAPEQYKGRGQSSPQTDIFGLGVILFQMLTKYDPTVKPFSFPSMDSLNPAVSGELSDIVMKAVQLEPVKRYISVAEFKEILGKYINPAKAVTPSRWEKLYVPRESEHKGMTLIEWLIVIAIIIILAAILLPNFLRTGTRSPLAACESNLKNIATGLEMYATDYEGLYPPSLEYLTRNDITVMAYMKALPKCPGPGPTFWQDNFSYIFPYNPSEPYGYTVSDKSDNFTIYCGKEKTHINYGDLISQEGCWPQYTPGEGLKLKGE